MGTGLVTIVSAAEPNGAYARLSISTLPWPCKAAFACATSTGDEKLEPEPVTKGEAGIAAAQEYTMSLISCTSIPCTILVQ